MQKKHKRLLYIGLIILMNIIVIILIIRALRNGAEHKNNIVAYVDNKPIYKQEVQQRLDAFLINANIQEKVEIESFPENFIKAIALEVSVSDKLNKLAKKENYHKNKEIRKLVDTYRNKLMREKFIQDEIMSNINDKIVQQRYAELTASLEGKEERKVKHILVKDEEEANRVRRAVLRSGNFDRVASQKSLDKSTAEVGGDLGYILKEEMVPEFGDVAFILEKGKLSKPVETQFGWHIIKVEDIREAKPLPFEEVKDEIKNRLQQEALQDYLKDITENSKVELMIKLNPKKTLQNNSSQEIEDKKEVEDLEKDIEEEMEEETEGTNETNKIETENNEEIKSEL